MPISDLIHIQDNRFERILRTVKHGISILFLIAFSTTAFYNAFVVADYFVRFDYYSTVLCENQDEPEMQCHGKCQLAVEKEEPQQAPKPQLKEFQVEYVTTSQNAHTLLHLALLNNSQNLYNGSDRLVKLQLVSRLLRPPQGVLVV